jgi:hypothetical protein
MEEESVVVERHFFFYDELPIRNLELILGIYTLPRDRYPDQALTYLWPGR